MKYKDIFSTPLQLIFLLFIAGKMFSQNIERDVVVTRDYIPVIQDANKISAVPEISDTLTIKPSFSYKIFPIPVKTQFEIKPIKPAKLVGIPVSEIYRYYLKAGVGNHHIPLIEAYANNLRSDKYSVGAALNIENLEGKVKLENGQKVTAASSDISLMGFGKIFLGKVNLETNAGIDLSKVHNYGLNPDSVYEPIPRAKNIKHNFNTVFLSGKLVTTDQTSSYALNTSLNEEYTWDDVGFNENYLDFLFQNRIKLSLLDLNVNGGFSFINNNLDNDSILKRSYITIQPFISNYTGDFRYKIGLTFELENSEENETSLFPMASLDYSLAGPALTTFFIVEGKVNKNRYKDILNENPFIAPGINPRSSKSKLIVTAGFKGDISRSVSYFIAGGLKSIEGQYFYVIDSVNELGNYFNLVYDDLDITLLMAGLNYSLGKKLDIGLSGNSYRYLTTNEDKAWHMPLWDIKTSVNYNIQEKINLKADLSIIGSRFIKENGRPKELKPFATFNFQVDYYFSKLLSAFLTVKNLNAAQYNIWQQYPYYKTIVIIGGSYKF